jgi:hypothetical protein
MSAGRKAKPEKSLPTPHPDRPATGAGKNAPPQAESPTKPGEPERKSGFAQGTYYRQGVLVPGGPHKSATPRGRIR